VEELVSENFCWGKFQICRRIRH